MENDKRIARKSDVEVLDVIKKLDTNDENAVKEVLVVLVETIVDLRRFLRKIHKNTSKPKTYKRPTDNKTDVVTG